MGDIPDPLVRKNRGFLGYDSSALSSRDQQVCKLLSLVIYAGAGGTLEGRWSSHDMSMQHCAMLFSSFNYMIFVPGV
jgi:hypothetical protein